MPIVFPDIDALEAYVDANIIANGVEQITGPINNNALNGCIEFIRQSPLNYAKASIENTAGAVIASTAVVVFTGSTPASLTWNDNIYNEYVFVNMTASDIPLLGLLVYYTPLGTVASTIPANTVINVFKAANDLWVQGNNLGSSTPSTPQKQPLSFVVGITANAPTVNTFTWTLPAFQNSWVVLFIGNLLVDMSDSGDGSPFISKVLASDTITISNYGTGWNNGDKISYILITP